MTITSTTNRVDYEGSDSTGPFSFPFKVFAATDLLVTRLDLDELETTLSYPTDFSVDGVGDGAGGELTLADELLTGETLTIRRVRPLKQETDIRNQGPYFPELHEDSFDHLVMIAQQLTHDVSRTLRLSETTDADVDTTLPVPAAGKAIVWNGDASGFDNADLSEDLLTAFAASENITLDRFVDGVGFTAGVSTTLTLSADPGSEDNVRVVRRTSGAMVEMLHDTFSVSGTTLTFSAAIPASTTYIEVSSLRTYLVNRALSQNVPFTAAGTGAIPREARAKLREFLTPEDFGAVGDGTTDDYAAIQAALDAVPERGKIHFTDGKTYITSDELILSTDYVTLEGRAVIKAKATEQFEYVLKMTALTGVTVRDLEIDANRANRSAGQSIRFNGIGFITCIECSFENVTIRNCYGFGGLTAVALVMGGQCIKCRAQGCRMIDNGATSHDADGIFSSGEQNVIANCIADNCTDTGFVVESSNYCVITGCTALECGAIAGITSASDDDKRGNIINGLVGSNNRVNSTGHIAIGVPSTNTGNLYDTVVANVSVYKDGAVANSGPIINVREEGFGRAIGVKIANCRLNGSTTQGILVSGDQVEITNCSIGGTTDACIAFKETSTKGFVSSCYLSGGSYGVTADGTSDAIVQSNVCRDQDYGFFAGDTATLIVLNNLVINAGTDEYGKDVGATLDGPITGIDGFEISGPDNTTQQLMRVIGQTKNPGIFVKVIESSGHVHIIGSGSSVSGQKLRLGAAGSEGLFDIDADGIEMDGTKFKASNLPTSAGASGTLWVDAGVVKRAP